MKPVLICLLICAELPSSVPSSGSPTESPSTTIPTAAPSFFPSEVPTAIPSSLPIAEAPTSQPVTLNPTVNLYTRVVKAISISHFYSSRQCMSSDTFSLSDSSVNKLAHQYSCYFYSIHLTQRLTLGCSHHLSNASPYGRTIFCAYNRAQRETFKSSYKT